MQSNLRFTLIPQLLPYLVIPTDQQRNIRNPFITQFIHSFILILQGALPALDVLLISLEDYLGLVAVEFLFVFFVLLA